MKKLLINIMLAIAFLLSPVLGNVSHAAAIPCGSSGLTAKQQIQCGSCEAAGLTVCDPGSSSSDIQGTIRTVVNILSVVGGIAAVIMIIYAGFRYVASAGNAEATKNARSTIMYAVIGLIIIALAQVIVHFVLRNVTNTTLNKPPSQSGGQNNGSSNNPSNGGLTGSSTDNKSTGLQGANE